MTVTILGSGTCVPSLTRSACAVMVTIGTGSKLLFDCGPGTMRRMLEAGTAIHEISHLFISHFHPDHTAELVPLLFATKYPDSRSRRRPLTIIAGAGFRHFFGGLQKTYGHWIDIGDQLAGIVELDTATGDSRNFGDFDVDSAPAAHNPESLAYRITAPGGRSVVYSGDTDYTDSLAALARGTEVLICESALPDKHRVPGHLTPSLAGKIASSAGVGKLVLTHFYPQCDQADIVAECRQTYDGPLVLAEDLMVIKV